MEAAGHRLGHSRRIVGNRIGEAVRLRGCYHAILSKSTVNGGADTRHILTEVTDAAKAILTSAAQLIGVYANTIAGLQMLYGRANLHDLTGKFVTQRRAGRGFGGALIAVEDMHVRAANTAGMDPDQHVPLTQIGDGRVLYAQIVCGIKYCCFHP